MPAKLRLHTAPTTAVSLAVILALSAAGLVASSSASTARSRPSRTARSARAVAGQPKCGDTITTDTTLHHDLTNCPNFGLKIGADDVTLDLNYHTIDGDGTPAVGCDPRREFCDVGVLNRGHDGVAVVHGSVRQFNVGVWGLHVSHNRLLGISSLGNQCCGLGLNRATRSLVRNSSGSGAGNVGMFLVHSQHIRVRHSSFRDNGAAPNPERAGQGIFVSDSTDNLIKGNLISRNGTAIIIDNGDRNQLRRNRIVRNYVDGIYLHGHYPNRNVIAGNRVAHVLFARGGEGVGIQIEDGNRNLIARNSVRDTASVGIAGGFGKAVGNVVRRNRIRGAGEDGVRVDNKGKHTHIRRNHVFGSKDDGFDVDSPKSKLTRNVARRNGDLGIEAVRGVIDGGGNKASGNGDPRQCTNIACSR